MIICIHRKHLRFRSYTANENMRCEVYIPKGEIAAGKLGQAFQFGAQVIQVDGNFDDALNQSLAKVNLQNGYTVNSVNPFRLEGQKTIVYRILENLDWNPRTGLYILAERWEILLVVENA